jgi:hypothetical protein
LYSPEIGLTTNPTKMDIKQEAFKEYITQAGSYHLQKITNSSPSKNKKCFTKMKHLSKNLFAFTTRKKYLNSLQNE